jgi:hypothetical protein
VRGSWIAGSVRARLVAAERRLGVDGARQLAESASLREALVLLGRSPYRRHVELDMSVGESQRAIASKALMDLRLLAGWLPADAIGLLRALAAWFELANLEDRIAYFDGAPLRTPFELGSLGVAWPRAAETQGLEELRRALAATPWGDPGGESSVVAGLGLRLAWARRVAGEAPAATRWASGAAGLLLAREIFVAGLPVEALPLPKLELLGPGWQTARTLPHFVRDLPPSAAWALEDLADAADLWRAEARWWSTVEADGDRLLHRESAGPDVVTGATALLAADAHRIVAALGAVWRRELAGVEEATHVAV